MHIKSNYLSINILLVENTSNLEETLPETEAFDTRCITAFISQTA